MMVHRGAGSRSVGGNDPSSTREERNPVEWSLGGDELSAAVTLAAVPIDPGSLRKVHVTRALPSLGHRGNEQSFAEQIGVLGFASVSIVLKIVDQRALNGFSGFARPHEGAVDIGKK